MTDDLALSLYRDRHLSVCQIVAAYPRCTVRGIITRLHRAGVSGGVTYCPIHDWCEELPPEGAP
jgi:hypothetical protein